MADCKVREVSTSPRKIAAPFSTVTSMLLLLSKNVNFSFSSMSALIPVLLLGYHLLATPRLLLTWTTPF